jgi:hypothetical protein
MQLKVGMLGDISLLWNAKGNMDTAWVVSNNCISPQLAWNMAAFDRDFPFADTEKPACERYSA